MIKILFFARYREEFGAPTLELPEHGLSSVGSLLKQLQGQFPARAGFLSDQKLIISVNQELATAQTPIKSGDEVALFPPVTGG